MKNLVLGILAHVDAGKTSLTEGILYKLGKIKKAGRVDHGDAFLDTYALEKERGITIFSKQTIFETGDLKVTLLDTPGHTDFSAEMERSLRVLDMAVLVISGTEGVQAHTRTLWRLIQHYKLPCFIFINKMDRSEKRHEELIKELRRELSDGCVDFTTEDEAFYEAVAENSEGLTEKFLEGKNPTVKEISGLIGDRLVFPCFFGSALKLEGLDEFLAGFTKYAPVPKFDKEFGARVYKISHDEKGDRLTYAKITGGSLKVKEIIKHKSPEDEESEEKLNQIRLYDGLKYETLQEAEAGSVVALVGLKDSYPGEGLGKEGTEAEPVLQPVLSRRMLLPEGADPAAVLQKLKVLEEENPELSVVWNERLAEIQLCTMGEIQGEILKHQIKERFDIDADFGPGNVLYKETINGPVEGVGHFEPLRHYAEVHLLLEPAKRGEGLSFSSDCSEDLLEKNWQRLILTHLAERVHKGVLTGSPITDMSIKLVRGRAHKKHTEGGDFRQATYRAVRQGLMQAESVLLEPYYDFRLEIPREHIGRGMTDIEKLHGKCLEPDIKDDRAILTGYGPVATLREYASEVTAYTRGLGAISFTVRGYDLCHNSAEVKARIGYDPDRDMRNPASSVFCAHGSGFVVEWDRVRDYMHEEGIWFEDLDKQETPKEAALRAARSVSDTFVGVEEVDAIIAQASSANRRNSDDHRKGIARKVTLNETLYKGQKKALKEEYLLVDGYNIVFAWPELNELAKSSLDAARSKLMDRLSNYQAIKGCRLTVVFDAYKLENHQTETLEFNNISVVYTKTAETADRYIEQFAHRHASEFNVTVATSDRLEQVIIMGAGCNKLSAEELLKYVENAEQQLKETFNVQ